MCCGGDDGSGTAFGEDFGGRDDGASGVDHVVDQDADLVFDITDDVFGHDGVLLSCDPSLVHDGQRCAQLVRVTFCDLHSTGVR